MPVSGLPPYDDTNVFAKILRGDLPSLRLYEDDYAIAFRDIAPQAPEHILIIPRGKYCSLADFVAGASDAEIGGFWRAVGRVAHRFEAEGYRALTNVGVRAGQEVPHFHVHVFAGRSLGPMLTALAAE